MPGRPRLAELGQHFRDVAHPRRKGVRARRPRRIVGEQLAVLLHRRSAAGRVDRDPVDAARLERLNQPAREASRLLEASGVQGQRAAAPLPRRRDHVAPFGGQHVDRRGVDVREHEPLHAAGQQTDDEPRRSDGRRSLGDAAGQRRPRHAGRERQQRADARRAAHSTSASARRRERRGRESRSGARITRIRFG